MKEINERLFDAIKFKDIEKMKKLIKKGVDVNAIIKNHWTPLTFASLSSVCAAKTLIDAGADVNGQMQGNKGTALHWAACLGFTKMVKFLIETNADVNAQDYEGKTPLYYAPKNGHADSIKLLIDVNAC